MKPIETTMSVELLHSTKDSQFQCEIAARTCYRSHDKMNQNNAGNILRTLIKKGHLSTIEHASASFRISGISRALSHQLVRHRLSSFSQSSQRYCSEDGFKYIVPRGIKNNEEAYKKFVETIEIIANAYHDITNLEGRIANEDARALLPNACSTELVMTANFREWLHVIDMRVSPGAQEEIRDLCIDIWRRLYNIAPLIFGLTYFEAHDSSKEFEFKKNIYDTVIVNTNKLF